MTARTTASEAPSPSTVEPSTEAVTPLSAYAPEMSPDTATMEQDLDLRVSPGDLWAAVRGKDVPRRRRDFIWKTYHQAHRIGGYWRHIPGYEHRELCGECGVEESMEHILTQCMIPGRERLWGMAMAMIKRKINRSFPLSLGMILGAPVVEVKTSDGRPNPGASRLARIVLLETAHLLWVARCERVIQREGRREEWHTVKELEQRWYWKLNERLRLDQAMTNPRLKTKALARQRVRATWTGVLHNELTLPEDWVGMAGVLVGRLTADEIATEEGVG